MVKKLTRTGNSVALVLDREILEATGLDAGSPVEVSTDGRVVVISPVADKKGAAKVDAILGKLDRRYARVFKKLAE
ncbi:MAG: AbrB/MazE/SpoVT family DNA-binding domain-containing protein [Deltaproteobacteria bacterium]|nr:AbrB/MazE/SpoVT family DNA-binding domain-containing protein [Deltaproteobacteria bacterium]